MNLDLKTPDFTQKKEEKNMNFVVFGASGMIGQQIAREALERGHHVTGIVRNPVTSSLSHERFHLVQGDASDPDSVAQAVAGHDVVISAIGHAPDDQESLVRAARALLAGCKGAQVRRLAVVGGAGSLEVAPGVQLMDTPAFPEVYRGATLAHRDALAVYRAEQALEWSVLSPPAFIAPGERTGRYRTATNQLLTDDNGESRISTEDYAVALIDEVEQPRFVRQRFTVAY